MHTHLVFRFAITVACVCLPRASNAQECTTTTSRTTLGTLSGAPILSVGIVALGPEPLPGTGDLVDRLHIRTLESTVRRQLLFAAGDSVDTLRVAETVRRLRQQRYLSDVWIDASRCGAAAGADLVVTVRDSWSTRPDIRIGASQSGLLGIKEINLLGTGRAVSAYVRARAREEPGARLGAGFMLNDPWLPFVNLGALVRMDRYADGSFWLASIRTRNRSVYDRWRGSVGMSRSTHSAFGYEPERYDRSAANVVAARIVSASPLGVTSLLFGAEGERTFLSAAPDAPIVGPSSVRREFLGLDIGLTRESASYDTLTWLLPRNALVDIPRGFEGEVLVGAGRDWSSRRPAMHIDLWGGRVWRPAQSILLVTDLWGSGFLGDRWEAGSLRALASAHARAPHGSWVARVGGQRIVRPDPDTRSLALDDPTARAYPEEYRLSRIALHASLERSRYLAAISRSWSVEGALFGAASIRNGAPGATPPRLHAGVIGASFRLAPRRTGRGTARIDIGYPVVLSGGLRQRPYIGIGVTPWLGAVRKRLGSGG